MLGSSSGQPASALVERVAHPERVIATHFWYPPQLIPLVEVCARPATDPGVVAWTCAALKSAGKEPALIIKEIPGFIGNRLQFAMLREAWALWASGAASAEAIDTVVRDSFGRRAGITGPLESADVGGLRTMHHFARPLLPHLDAGAEPPAAVADLVARDAIVATNGYSGPAWRWLQRRVIPFDAYQAVSSPLGEARVAALLAGDRTFIDWNFDVDWFRRVPDDPSRIQFGGLTGGRNEDLRSIARRLRARMLRIFPGIGDLAVSHVWTVRCAGTFDFEPRIGLHDGIHYAGGYCFVGVPMGTLFGRKLASRVLARPGGDSAFDRPFRTAPFYRGDPWFVPLAFRWMRRHDR